MTVSAEAYTVLWSLLKQSLIVVMVNLDLLPGTAELALAISQPEEVLPGGSPVIGLEIFRVGDVL